MTIDEAKEIIQGKLNCMKKCWIFNKEDNDNDNDCDNCEYCYSQGNFGEQKEAFQIAINSLEELKAIKEKGRYVQGNKAGQKIGYRNAIDDFEILMKEAMNHDWATTKICDQIIYNNLYDKCNEIAEQLKAGGDNE